MEGLWMANRCGAIRVDYWLECIRSLWYEHVEREIDSTNIVTGRMSMNVRTKLNSCKRNKAQKLRVTTRITFGSPECESCVQLWDYYVYS